jgi:hypothetical protein
MISVSFGIARHLRKNTNAEEQRPLTLKPALISSALRGPEGPIFHGDAFICELFRNLSYQGVALQARDFQTLPRRLRRRNSTSR